MIIFIVKSSTLNNRNTINHDMLKIFDDWLTPWNREFIYLLFRLLEKFITK